MKALRIILGSGDGVDDILGVLSRAEEENLIFECPRNTSFLSNVSFLKKLKNTAKEKGKKISFVIPQKFIRDIVASQKFEVFSKITKKIENISTKKIKDFSKNVQAQKNKAKTTPKTETPGKKSKSRPKFSMNRIENEASVKSSRGKFFFGLLGVIAVLAGVWFWISPRAEIVLKPKLSVIPVTQNIVVTFADSVVPEEEKFLPQIQGIFVETAVTDKEIFPSSGRRYDITNASGKVTLFNETSKPKFLIPSRLSTLDGVIVRFGEEVTIPARNAEGPGRLEVTVTADAYDANEKPIGSRGNFDAGTSLFFPALRENLQELYYAKANKGPLTGGSTLTHYFIQEGEFEKIRDVLVETFRIRAVEQLQKEISSRSEREGKQYVLLSDPRLQKVELLDSFFPENLVGQEVQTFDVTATLKLSEIVFDQTQVEEFLAAKLRETQDQRKKLLRLDELSALYRVLNFEQLEDGKWLKLSVEMKGIETLDMDSDSTAAYTWRENLKKEIAGKSLKEAQSFLTNIPEIDNVVDIVVSPPWAKKLPGIMDQIKFKITE